MELGKTQRIILHCLNCGEELNRATSIGEGIANQNILPSPNDVTVCLECGHVMAYDNELMPRELTPEEELQVAGDKRILTVQKERHFIRMMREIIQRSD